jgi:hypothetical protein
MAFGQLVSARHKPWDTVGLLLSVLCLVHCMVMPLFIACLPVFGLEWLAADGFHRWLAVAAIIFGAMSFIPGYLRHRRAAVPFLGGLGLLVLCGAAAIGQEQCCTNE